MNIDNFIFNSVKNSNLPTGVSDPAEIELRECKICSGENCHQCECGSGMTGDECETFQGYCGDTCGAKYNK